MHFNNTDTSPIQSRENSTKECFFKRSRHDREHPYVMISRKMINDQNLSYRAKFILIYLLNLPDDWKVYPKQVAKYNKMGRDQIYKVINELIQNGYCKRTQIKDESNKFCGYVYEFSEDPIFLGSISKDEKLNPEIQEMENHSKKPFPEIPAPGKKATTNKGNILSNEVTNIYAHEKKKKIKEPRIERMHNIHTSETEHKYLIEKFGEEKTKQCYEYLSEWKESKEDAEPKSMNKHIDFYRIKKWVLAAVMEKSILSPKKEEVSVEKTYENRQKFEVFRRKYYELFRKKSIYLQDRVQYAEIKNDKIYFNDFKFDEKFECAIRKHGINLNEDRNTRQSDSENETQDD